MSFTVIKTGGKQYKVAKGEKIKIDKLSAKEGESIEFDKVLLQANGKSVKIGQPYVEGAKVSAKVLKHGKDKKVIVFRYKPKTRYKRKKGFRRSFTEVEIIKVDA